MDCERARPPEKGAPRSPHSRFPFCPAHLRCVLAPALQDREDNLIHLPSLRVISPLASLPSDPEPPFVTAYFQGCGAKTQQWLSALQDRIALWPRLLLTAHTSDHGPLCDSRTVFFEPRKSQLRFPQFLRRLLSPTD